MWICVHMFVCVHVCICVIGGRLQNLWLFLCVGQNSFLFFNLLQALNDDIPEEKCSYEFQLTGISEGAVLNEASVTASISMVASDTPYGRFSFSHEQLQVSEAAQKVWCGLPKFYLLTLVWGVVLK